MVGARGQAHLHGVGMTYGQHARRSLELAGAFGACAARAIVHAVAPGMYTTASTDSILTELPKRLGTAGQAKHSARSKL